MGSLDKLAGELVTLRRIKRRGWEAVFERFQDPELYDKAGLKKPPERGPFFEDLEEDELFVYDLIPDDSSESIAYGVFVHYDGPPYVFIHFFSGEVQLDLAQDAMLCAVNAYFRGTDEPSLYTFAAKPVPPEIHDSLLEGGFDFIEDYPVINNDEEACYCMERVTWESYYGDEEDDEVEELDFE